MATRIERRHYKYLKATMKRKIYGPFECPRCGSDLFFRKESDSDIIQTSCQCGLSGQWKWSDNLLPIDYYSRLVDENRQKDPRTSSPPGS